MSTRIPLRFASLGSMQFTLDGEHCEVTPELVRGHLVGQVPEQVRKSWVVVDGVRWPVKQVIALATGVERDRFRSRSARRWLAGLGFDVGRASSEADRAGTSSPAVPPRQQACHTAQLEELESLDLRVSFSWFRAGAVVLDGAGKPQLPPLPSTPGLYRFDFSPLAAGTRAIYIGESRNVARRGRKYRNAIKDRERTRTSRRIHRELVAHLVGGVPMFLSSGNRLLGRGVPVEVFVVAEHGVHDVAAAS